MGRKRLITDSFQVVKRQRQDPDTKKGSLQPEVVPVPDDAPPGGSLHPAPLEMLKQFDLSWEYGPCTGITRLQRWERAKSLGLSPPLTVRETLLEREGDPSFMHCLWHDYPL
ncbi:DNA polymerase delta subunit 4 isoform X1 [Trachemys scripta elegans]|uniref:DNA polymerase delta subunit 4 isoform X1 n=1 Tax=Trachemys scripta elegans TaxID=31138 RepID=UPI00155740CE|nr:DNA polymerase delta subunit 4 isoform X1 [Trachemys scripta elegans]XP_034623627.1 DNA polymerase delta subunit 4 isoform X1 [Trachemys scripta elegans]XP_053883316.1 DNA polymerase delta subunit 4 isoform X1 [Malaclemys terrapin pileata]XP_053883319.1 DNA polymerase delta subunit 4 isoform X1 [Malaclemys terrapin pileata]XP_053883320.1 DNA polymerase delta subunit 4 isoform X1 [Malaclemys terrapin pileata]